MERTLAKVAFLLACGSPFSLLWMVTAFPHVGRHPSAIVNAVFIGLALTSPLGAVLGFILLGLPSSPRRERTTTPYAAAAMTIGICAGLGTAFFFPFFAQTKPSHRQSCASHLKQLSLAMLMYAQDYDETLPRAAQWNDLTMPYVKNDDVYRCPDEDSEKLPSYGMNGALDGGIMAGIELPDRAVQLIDSKPGVNKVVGLSDYPFTDRHETFLYTGFVDGHVKGVRKYDVQKLDWNPKAPAAGKPRR